MAVLFLDARTRWMGSLRLLEKAGDCNTSVAFTSHGLQVDGQREQDSQT